MKKIFFIAFFSSLSLLAEEAATTERTYNSELIPEQGDHFESAFKKMLWALSGVVILVIITVWMLKRLSKIRLVQNNRFSTIKILEKRNLSPKSILYVVEVGRKRILISESQLEIRKIETLPHLTELDEEV